MRKIVWSSLAGASMTALAMATPAWAQVTGPTSPENQPEVMTTPPADETAEEEEIVVTGTQIRGIAPPGANILSITEEQVRATGATSTQQLLATIPQTTAFNNLGATLPGQGVSAGVTRVPVARPNIRNLPGCAGAGSGACTLILIDGHRLVPAGIEQTAVDPNIIPPGIIERVETILDGNSAIYGSDAIGGVINFITRKRFEGVRVDGRYGIGNDYHSIDANGTVGLGWGSGSVVATYSFARNDDIFGYDRDYIKSINALTGDPTSVQCDLANVQSGAIIRAAPGFLPGQVNRCDPSDFATLYPKNRRHTGFVSLTQDFGDSIEFGVSGFYSDFRTESNTGPARGSVTLASFPLPIPIPGATGPNPYFQFVPSLPFIAPGVQTYTALFSYGPALGNDFGTQVVRFKSWQVTPTLTADLGGDWQVGALFTYGHSRTTTAAHSINPITQLIAAGGTTAATALNPFNIAGTNATVLANLDSWYDRGIGVNKMINARVKADGTLFDLPGGGVKAAVGLEYQKNRFARQATNVQTFAFDPEVVGSVKSTSAFGELFIPIVGADNEMTGIHRLNLSLSGRYDHYDGGVGGTFNPKVALTFEPTDWITTRANWGKSFNAPTPSDRVGEQLTRVLSVTCGNPCPFGVAGVPLPPSSTYNVIFVTGATPGLTPQKSTNWSVGIDLRPTFVPNLVLSATLYNIKIKDFISLPQVDSSVQQAFRDFPELVLDRNEIVAGGVSVVNGIPIPTAIYNQCVGIGGSQGSATCLAAAANGQPFAVFVDNRVRNLGQFKIRGLDFAVNYRREVNFGSLDFRFSANYQLKRDFAPHAGDPFTNTLFSAGVPDFTSSTTIGANVGDNFRFQATWNHTGKYDFLTTPGVHLQDKVGGFDTVDLFFRYDVKGSGLTQDLAFTLNVNNALNVRPPLFLTTTGEGSGVAPRIRTLGRVLLLGIEKTF